MGVGNAVPRTDFLDLSGIKHLQQARWAQQAENIQSSSAFYRAYLNGRQLASSLDEPRCGWKRRRRLPVFSTRKQLKG